MLDLFNAGRISARPATAVHDLGVLCLVTNAEVYSTPDTVRSFCGNAFFARRFLSNFFGLSAENVSRFARFRADHPFDVAGTFSFLEWSQSDGHMRVNFDVFNMAPCFVTTDRRDWAVSNNVHLLAALLRQNGAKPERQASPFIAEMVFNCGYVGGSPWSLIEPLEPHRKLELGSTLEILPGPDIRTAFADVPTNELVAVVGDRIAERVAVLAEMPAPIRHVLDVTGGMDSRILLAAVIRSRTASQWSFNRLFPFPNPDGNFAEMIGERFGMKRVNLGLPSEDTPFGQYARQVYHSQGLEAKEGYLPQRPCPHMVRLHGCFGELAGKNQDVKRFLRRLDGPLGRDNLVTGYLAALSAVGYDRILSPDGKATARDMLSGRIDAILGEGHAIEAMPALFYARGKARSHYGMISHLRGMRTNYPDVLNDPALVVLAMRTGPRKSMGGRVNFDLVRYLGGDEIAALPLADTHWDKAIFDEGADVQRFVVPPITQATPALFAALPEQADPVPVGFSPLAQAGDPPGFPHRKGETPSTRTDIARAICRMEEVRAALDAGLGSFLDHATLERLLTQSEPLQHADTVNLNLVAQAGIWMAGLEQRYVWPQNTLTESAVRSPSG